MELRHKPYMRLEGFKRENGITNLMIANALGITETSVVRKNAGKSDYYLSEVNTLKETLDIPVQIFFD